MDPKIVWILISFSLNKFWIFIFFMHLPYDGPPIPEFWRLPLGIKIGIRFVWINYKLSSLGMVQIIIYVCDRHDICHMVCINTYYSGTHLFIFISLLSHHIIARWYLVMHFLIWWVHHSEELMSQNWTTEKEFYYFRIWYGDFFEIHNQLYIDNQLNILTHLTTYNKLKYVSIGSIIKHIQN